MNEYKAKREIKLFSLQDMAFDTALKNLGRYKELIKSTLSAPFRKELYEAAMKSVWEKTYEQRHGLWTALPYLEPHKTAEIFHLKEFGWVIQKLEAKPGNSDSSYDYQRTYAVSLDQILRYLVLHAPNLKQMFIDDPRPFDFGYQRIHQKPQQLEQSSIDLIAQFKYLTKISIRSVTINFTGFARICRKFENLQQIEAEKIVLDVPKSNMKTILETLNTAFDHQEYNECNFPTKFGIIFKKTDSVENYRKAKVELDDSIFVDSLPEITHLEASCGDECENYRCHMKNLQNILRKVGGNLEKLTLNYFDRKSKLTFNDIFGRCKSLEYLHLERSFIADDKKPFNSFGKLKELRWNNPDPDCPINLKNILCAPLLENIVFTGHKFDLGNKEALFNRIRKGVICTNVNHFTVEHMAYVDEPVSDDFYRLFEAINTNFPEPIFSKLEIVWYRPRRSCSRWQHISE